MKVYAKLDKCMNAHEVYKWVAESGVPTRKELEECLLKFAHGSDDGIDEKAEEISKKYSAKIKAEYAKLDAE